LRIFEYSFQILLKSILPEYDPSTYRNTVTISPTRENLKKEAKG